MEPCVTPSANLALMALGQSAGQGILLKMQFSNTFLIAKIILFKDVRRAMMIMEHFVLKMHIYLGKAAAAQYSAGNAVAIAQ